MDRLANIELAIECLKAENPRFSALQIAPTLADRQRQMRALLNVRPPRRASPTLLRAQDAELAAQRGDKGVVEVAGQGARLWRGDITRLAAGAIVNAANSAMRGCFQPLHECVDNAIHSAAGLQMRLRCDEIMRRRSCPEAAPGDAIMTDGYNLPAANVVHALGPMTPRGIVTHAHRAALAQCYRRSLDMAAEAGLRSVAFPCISTGVFLFPPKEAAHIATRTVRKWLQANVTSIETVLFCVFKQSDHDVYKSLGIAEM